MGRRIKELERLYGIEHGGDRKSSPNNSVLISQEQLAAQMDISVDTLQICNDATIIDVMEWMINTQLGRRNLPPQQRIAVIKKFEKKIQEQAAIKKETSDKQFYGNRFTGKIEPSPNGEHSKNKIRTDKELAKLAGVGTGTIARFNRVMSSDDEELKKKLLADEVKIWKWSVS